MFVDVLLNSNVNYSLSLIFFSVISYIITLTSFFLVLFVFDLKKFKNITDFKYVTEVKNYNYYFLMSLMSIAGIPPLLGFFSKSLILYYLFSSNNLSLSVFFIFFNIFSVYFYLQNYRFIVKTKQTSYIKVNDNFNYLFVFNIFFFFNFFSFFFIESFFIKINSVFVFMNF